MDESTGDQKLKSLFGTERELESVLFGGEKQKTGDGVRGGGDKDGERLFLQLILKDFWQGRSDEADGPCFRKGKGDEGGFGEDLFVLLQ